MQMSLASRLIFTVTAIGLVAGAHAADLSASHIFNPDWPPHAKFHTGQTLAFSIALALMTLFFAWRRSDQVRTNVLAASGFASIYWLTQAAAILYPGTAFFDPRFDTPDSYVLGLPGQVLFQAVFLSLVGVAAWLGLRRHSARPTVNARRAT